MRRQLVVVPVRHERGGGRYETYTVMGTQLTVTDPQGKPQTSDYCVSGDTLTVRTSTSVGHQIAVLARQ